MSKDLELALRIKADLDQGRQELAQLAGSLNQTGEAADAASAKLTRTGETADQQTTRIQAMVQASLANASAQDDARVSLEGLTQTQGRANATWQQAAAAQDKAMQATSAAVAKTAQNSQALAASSSKAASGMQQGAAAAGKQSQELTELLGRIDPVVRELDRLDDMERQLSTARRAGRIDVDTYDLYNAKLTENRTRLTANTAAMGRGAITAGQYRQAMRQLPMQITDVTTSLVSGMPIWMVAVQQGGQIKDSFGGIGPAARAVVSAINPMTLAIGAAVATMGALAIAYEQGAGEARKYREALTLTGNAAGTSTDQLAGMAERIDGIVGTQRQAAAALAAAARTGKIAGADLERVAQTAVQMQVAMGQSVEETIAEYVELAKDPVSALSKLDDKYHFLTASVLEQVHALQDQGDEAGAARLAMDTYSDTMQERTQQIAGDLGLIESAWKGIKNVATEAWDAMLDVGREETIEDKLADIERRRTEARFGVRGDRAGLTIDPGIQLQLDAERDRLLADKRKQDLAAETAGQEDAARQKATDAVEYINKLREEGLTREEKKTKAIAEYWREIEALRAGNPNSELLSEENVARGLADIETKFAPPKTRTPTDKDAAAAERWVAQLEREAATYGKDRSELKKYELGLMDLSEAQRARAATANAALATAEAQAKADKQSAQDTKLLAQLQLDYLKATGQAVDAAEAEIVKKYGALRERLLSGGKEDGVTLVDKLIGIEKAQAQIADLEQQIDRVFAEQSRREQTINTQQEAGLISEIGARNQILDLNKATTAEIEKLLPQMRELAAVTGDPAAIERVKDLESRLASLRTIANDFANALRSGFETGIQDALRGLADGTMNLQEAALSFVQAISGAMADLAAQQLAAMATDQLAGLFDGGGDEGAGLTIGAAAVTASAGALGTAGGTLLTGAAAIQAAAASLAAANVTSSAAGVAAATGGHITGPGTGTSDSISASLSNNEFVTRAAVVTQPGMLPILHDINKRGRAALDDWASVRHATGGLAGVPAPAMPSPGMGSKLAEPAAAAGTTLKNSQNFYLVDDPSRIGDVMSGPVGRESIAVAMSREPGKFRSILGIN